MKRFFLLISIFFFAYTYAKQISLIDATKIVNNFWGTEYFTLIKATENYCIFQRDKRPGFVIVSMEDSSKRKILAYSNECNWDENIIPPVILSWLDSIRTPKTRIKNVPTGDEYLFLEKDIPPLLTCKWHQSSPYNDLAPIIADGNVKTAAGCVAIAAAQIIYYWRRDNPEFTLRDTPTYIYGKAPITDIIPKGTPNDWELLQDLYDGDESSESRAAVARLCYVIGTTSYLNYGSSSSGSIKDASNAMFSQYRLRSEYISKSDLSYSEWIQLLYNNIVYGYPVICSGVDNDGGHAFILDGYDSNTGLFHFNFGWGGSGDGYYPIDDSNISMGGYSKRQSIVYNIHPNSRNIETSFKYTYDNTNVLMVNVNATIKNNSTLPIKHLYIYIVPNNFHLEDVESPIWTGPGVNNDGIEYPITVSFNLKEEDNITLYLTDEHKNELAHYSLDIRNAIENVTINKTVTQAYNLFGQKVTNPTMGIYIVDDGINKKKVLKKYHLKIKN